MVKKIFSFLFHSIFLFLGFFFFLFWVFFLIIIISSSNTMKLKYFCTFCIFNVHNKYKKQNNGKRIYCWWFQYSCKRLYHLVLCYGKHILSTGRFVDRIKRINFLIAQQWNSLVWKFPATLCASFKEVENINSVMSNL